VTESDDFVVSNRKDHHPVVLILPTGAVHRASVLPFDDNSVILSRDLKQLEALRPYFLTEFLEVFPDLLLRTSNS
jgi:hypothetical protein